jgi:hypothetical protein
VRLRLEPTHLRRGESRPFDFSDGDNLISLNGGGGDLGNKATFEWGRVLAWGLWRPNPTRKRIYIYILI